MSGPSANPPEKSLARLMPTLSRPSINPVSNMKTDSPVDLISTKLFQASGIAAVAPGEVIYCPGPSPLRAAGRPLKVIAV